MPRPSQKDENQTDKQYEVQKILDRKIDKEECYYYHIKWVGYSQTTWQPLSNLVGGQVVQKMIADFQKNLEKKSKNNWSKGLQGWANISKNPPKNIQNVTKESLDQTFYKTNDNQIIDLDSRIDEPIVKKKKHEGNPFIGSKVKMKMTSNKVDRYPFEKEKQHCQCPNFMKTITQIKRIERIENKAKCLVTTKNTQIGQQWMQTDIVRLIAPQLLLESYQKVSHQNQPKNNNIIK